MVHLRYSLNYSGIHYESLLPSHTVFHTVNEDTFAHQSDNVNAHHTTRAQVSARPPHYGIVYTNCSLEAVCPQTLGKVSSRKKASLSSVLYHIESLVLIQQIVPGDYWQYVQSKAIFLSCGV